MEQCGYKLWPYCIDWAATGAMLGGFAAIVTGLAVIASALLAWKTYREWRAREAYVHDRQKAVEILSAFYEGREVISAIRSRFIEKSESEQAALAVVGVTPANVDALSEFGKRQDMTAEVMVQRIYAHAGYWTKLGALVPEARALFSDDVGHLLNAIFLARRKVELAARHYAEADRQEQVNMRRMMFSLPALGANPKTDTVETELAEAQEKIEAALERFIHRPET